MITRNPTVTGLLICPNSNQLAKCSHSVHMKPGLVETSKEPVCPRVELLLKIIIILQIIFLGFIKSKPC